MARKRAAVGTVLTALAIFALVFFIVWALMSLVERFITGQVHWPGQKPKVLRRTAIHAHLPTTPQLSNDTADAVPDKAEPETKKGK
mmetsp:Transcript_26477/g.69658  ORF Transcript_26477/g.69658 Transcript_26477/m.69658 type:complete len:86 (+) Transcript_26477:51-308(+)